LGVKNLEGNWKMTYQGFISRLNRKQVAPAYLFEGEDLYTRRVALRKLKKKLISPARQDFNFSLFSAPGASTQVIVETLSLLPLKDDWRLIVLEDADKLTQGDQLIIANYLKRPVDSSCLVCLGGKFDQRKRFYQAFRKKGEIVTFNPPGQREAQALVKEIEEREEKKVSSQALGELLERCQGDLDRLKNEMEKLILFIHPRKIIEREDVVEITGQGKGEGIFDFLALWRKKEMGKAFFVLGQLLSRGENPLRIHALMVREVRTLLEIKALGKQVSPARVVPLAFKGKNPSSSYWLSKAREYIIAAKNFRISELFSLCRLLWEEEYAIKKGIDNPESALEKIIIQTVGSGLNI